MDRQGGDIQALVEANSEAVRKGFDRAWKEGGYKKKGTTWRKETDDTVLVANLQKSAWGAQFYINLGVLIKELDDIPNPTENKCHLRDRLEEQVRADGLKAALDAENFTLAPAEHERAVYEAVRDIGAPFLELCTSLSGLIHGFKAGKIQRSALRRVSDDFIAKHASMLPSGMP